MIDNEEWCEKYEMAAIGCAHCRGQHSVEEQAEQETLELRAHLLATDPRWFPSNYPGRCGKCGTGFEPGTLIRRAHSGIDLLPPEAWVAECCAVAT